MGGGVRRRDDARRWPTPPPGEEPTIPALPAGEVLAGLRIPALPEGATPTGMVAFVKLDEADGGTGWSVRMTSNIDEDETPGILVGYTHHLNQQAAESWDYSDPTRADD
jgi:hypothetical protein